MTRWMILGSGGQLGQCLQEALTEKSIPYVPLRSSECDITDDLAVDGALDRHLPRVVVNCAAWTAVDSAEDNVDDAFAVNCTGATNVAVACRKYDATLVHVSTDYVFPGDGPDPYAEDSATAPVSVYGKSKLCGESEVLRAHPEGSYIVRTAWLYSRYGGNFAKTMTRRAFSGASVRVVNDQRGQPTLANDLARHIIDLVDGLAPVGVYHGTNSGNATWYDFAREIYRLSSADEDLVHPVESSEYPTRATRPKNSVLSHFRTTHAGIDEMRHWRDALREEIPHIMDEVRSEDQK